MPSSPTPDAPVGTRVRLDLLAGSAMTVKVPGRPDRSASLSGTLRGFLPGKFKPNSDLRPDGFAGTVTVTGLPADPMCTSNGRPSPTSFDVVNTSSMVVFASGFSYFTVLPSEDLLGVTGCQGVPPVATRGFALAGKVGPPGLTNVSMTGTIGDVTLSDGALATITLSLVVRIDLSGK